MKYLRVFNSRDEIQETFPSDNGEIPDNVPEVFVFTNLGTKLFDFYENIYSWRVYHEVENLSPIK